MESSSLKPLIVPPLYHPLVINEIRVVHFEKPSPGDDGWTLPLRVVSLDKDHPACIRGL